MADENAGGAHAATQDPPPQPQKFAGKYDTFEAFEKGIHEARKAVGLPELSGKVIGQDGFYADVRAAEMGYRDLTSMMRMKAPATPTTPATPGKVEIPATPPAAADDLDIPAVLGKAGLTQDALVQQFLEHGKLTDDQYAKIKAVNPAYGKALVDSTMRGEIADVRYRNHVQQEIQAKAASMVGGADQLGNLLGWAVSLPEAVKTDLNRRLSDPDLYEGALVELQQRHSQAVGAGSAAPLIDAGRSNPAQTGGFSADADPQEFFKTMKAAQRGDRAAMQRIQNTPNEVFSALSVGR